MGRRALAGWLTLLLTAASRADEQPGETREVAKGEEEEKVPVVRVVVDHCARPTSPPPTTFAPLLPFKPASPGMTRL